MLGLLRVKNESRWIAKAIASIKPICRRVLVFDDHSTDETAAICTSLGAQVFPSPFESTLDEVRDKNWLLAKAFEQASAGEWALMIDGDEELYAPDAFALRDWTQTTTARCGVLKVLYLWNDPGTIRTDGVYGHFGRASVWRLDARKQFQGTGHGGNFHCGNAPFAVGHGLDVRLLHYGYMDRADRLRKYEWYRQMDPDAVNEDGYRHMVIGDVFPADAKCQHGGPLQLEAL